MPRHRTPPPPIPRWGWYVIGSFITLLACVFLIGSGLAGKAILSAMEALVPLLGHLCVLALWAFLALLYFLPSIIGRRSPRFAAIFAMNLLLGWTFIGWIIALIWALAEQGTLNNRRHPNVPPPL